MNGMRKVALSGLLCGLVVTGFLAGDALAQEQGLRPPGSTNAAPGRPAAQPKTGAPAAPRAAPAEAAPRSDAQLRQRVEELEKELVDMHVLVGTLETLARQGGGGGGPSGGGGGFAPPLTGAEAGRISALETQVQALTIQVEQLMAQVRAMGGGGDGRRPAPSGFQKSNPAAGGGFGSTVVTPGGGGGSDPIGDIISGGGGASGGGRQVAMGPGGGGAGAAGGAAKVAYEAAYAQLLQQDYDGAEAGFTEFLQRHPNDSMAANAQYWLGETYYLRGRFDAAAQAFLLVVQKHGNSLKAPDSLAKLAMSLDRNGKRPAACAALGELNKRFPNPPAHVKNWEQAERRRTGCT